jgi:acyl dehydratase
LDEPKRQSANAQTMGLWFHQFVVGDVHKHDGRLIVTMDDNVAFCQLTKNTQPLHLDEEYAKGTPFGQIVVNGLYTFSASVGMSVPDLTEGTLVANLGYDDVKHPKPVFIGDELQVESEVLEARPSSKPGRGIVKVAHTVRNQSNDVVCSYSRVAIIQEEQ